MITSPLFRPLSCIFLVVLLSGCSGGGGGGSIDTNLPVPDDSSTAAFELGLIDTAGRKPYEVEMAFTDSGQGVAVWPGVKDGSAPLGPPLSGTGECWANRYEPVDGWGSPIKISASSFCYAGDTRVGVSIDDNNDIAAVWRALYGNIQVASIINGVVGESREYLYDRANFPAISAGRPGGVVAAIAWEGEVADNLSDHQVLSATYTLGSGWSAMEALPESANTDVDPVIAVLDDGRRIAAWIERGLSGPSIIQASIWSPITGWSTPVVINTANGELDSYKVTIAPGINGRALLVWDEHNPGTEFPDTTYSLKASWFDSASWQAPWVLDPDISVLLTSAYLLRTRVGVDSLGNALVAWIDVPPSTVTIDPVVKTSKYRNGQWEPAEQIVSPGMPFELDINASGDAAVVWIGDAGSIMGRGTHISTSSEWTIPIIIKSLSLTESTSYQPHVALSPDGEAIIVWAQLDIFLGAVDPIEHFLWSAIVRFE